MKQTIKNLSHAQAQIAALLAYECLRKYNHEKKEAPKTDNELMRNREEWVNILICIGVARHACALVSISDDLIIEIMSGKIKGLKNLMKISGNYFFEQDYEFNPY